MKTELENAFAMGHCGILLGNCWLKEMTHQSLAALGRDASASLKEALLDLGWEIPCPNDETIEALQIDYCRLLIGPKGHLSPVESVWATRQFQSDCVSSMQSFFELLPEYQPPESLLDHIGVQLDCAGHLLIAASHSRHREALEPMVAFAETRLAWPEDLLTGVQERAETEFYRGLANATRGWIAAVQKTGLSLLE